MYTCQTRSESVGWPRLGANRNVDKEMRHEALDKRIWRCRAAPASDLAFGSRRMYTRYRHQSSGASGDAI
jgi:hypothetical protein